MPKSHRLTRESSCPFVTLSLATILMTWFNTIKRNAAIWACCLKRKKNFLKTKKKSQSLKSKPKSITFLLAKTEKSFSLTCSKSTRTTASTFLLRFLGESTEDSSEKSLIAKCILWTMKSVPLLLVVV
jgi:hypothetical protein